MVEEAHRQSDGLEILRYRKADFILTCQSGSDPIHPESSSTSEQTAANAGTSRPTKPSVNGCSVDTYPIDGKLWSYHKTTRIDLLS